MSRLSRISQQLAAIAVLLSPFGLAQEPPSEVHVGDYQVQQSMEIGVRYADFSGSRALSDTLIDLHSGPRIFEQSLELDSIDHHGFLFDNLSLRSQGIGGD